LLEPQIAKAPPSMMMEIPMVTMMMEIRKPRSDSAGQNAQ
jgi:hypothetical protein